MPLDELNLDPALVKIDVEGLDHQVLQGLSETTQRARPTFLIEYTPATFDSILGFFDEKDYGRFLYDHASNEFRDYSADEAERTWRSQGLQINVFFVPNEKSGLIRSRC